MVETTQCIRRKKHLNMNNQCTDILGGSRGWGQGSGLHPEKLHKIKGFVAILVRTPPPKKKNKNKKKQNKKNNNNKKQNNNNNKKTTQSYQASIQYWAIIGTPANAFKWRFAGGQVTTRLKWYLNPLSPHQLKGKKNVVKVEPPLTELSGTVKRM